MNSTRHGSAVVTTPSDTEILITRRFDASAPSVFRAWTTPELVRRWWGSDDAPLVVCEIDLRVGGDWRYVSRHPEHGELGWHGTYEAIVPNVSLVSSEVFEGFPDAASHNTLTLAEHDGVTTLTVLVAHTSREHRDGHIDSGMEPGMQRTLDRLDDLLPRFDEPIGSTSGSDTSQRWRRVAGTFTERVNAVPPARWSNPAPCEGWVARDVVRHLVEWVPAFLRDGADLTITPGPDVDVDPAKAWGHLNNQIVAVLDASDIATRAFDHPRAGEHPLAEAIDRFILGDVLIHTWDLSRATGLDEHLDDTMVNEMLIGLEPMADVLVQSGHYGPRVPIAVEADPQSKLLALTGRRL